MDAVLAVGFTSTPASCFATNTALASRCSCMAMQISCLVLRYPSSSHTSSPPFCHGASPQMLQHDFHSHQERCRLVRRSCWMLPTMRGGLQANQMWYITPILAQQWLRNAHSITHANLHQLPYRLLTALLSCREHQQRGCCPAPRLEVVSSLHAFGTLRGSLGLPSWWLPVVPGAGVCCGTCVLPRPLSAG